MTSAYPGDAYPGQVYPSQLSAASALDATPQQNVRVECAFASDPDDANPKWVDLSGRADLTPGITINRGRPTEHDSVSPGRCTVTLDNSDGALTPGRASSPYYPNVKVGRRLRVTYRDSATLGAANFLTAEAAGFEGGTTGGWTSGFGVASTVANSTTRAHDGTRSLLVTWPTAAAAGSDTLTTLSGLTIGRSYTAAAWVWVPAGSPPVKIGFQFFGFAGGGSPSTVTGAWQRITTTFSAIGPDMFLSVTTSSASTAGQQVWIDSVMVDEGAALGPFTTTPPVVSYRFDGYVDQWPIQWEGGPAIAATSTVTASDILARIGARKRFGSVVEETARLDDPKWYYTLGEPEGSTTAGDQVTSGNAVVLTARQVGSGGTVEFGKGTGVPTDGLTAPIFTPVNTSSGWRLEGRKLPAVTYLEGFSKPALEVTFNTSVAADTTVVRWSDIYGAAWLEVGTTAAGKVAVSVVNLWNYLAPNLTSITSAATVTDGQTHHVAADITTSAGTSTLTVYLDGASIGTSTYTAAAWFFENVTIGGRQDGGCFTGTISHVAGYSGGLNATRVSEHNNAQKIGFAGERSDQRLTRVADWCGVPSSRRVFDTGKTTTMAHLDPTGVGGLDYLRRIERTEAGLLYADGQGRLVFKSRATEYTPKAPDVTVDAGQVLDPGVQFVLDLERVINDVTATRPGGPSARATDDASVTAYGEISTSLDLLTTSDGEVADAANWRLRGKSTPTVRVPQLAFDALTEPTSGAALRGMDLLAYIRVTGLPSQAPTSQLDQVVQGFTERISATGWTITANTTDYDVARALILDDATFGKSDDANVLVY